MEKQTQKEKRGFMRTKGRLLELIVILLCMLLLGVGVSRKEGFHMDELLSFELSNAEFNPWIVTTQPEGRLAKFVKNEIKGESFGETLQNLVDTVEDVLQNRGNSVLLTYEADVYEEPVWITAEQFHDYITVEDDAFNYLSVYFNVKDDNHPPVHFMLLHTMSSLFQGQAKPWMGCVINMVCVAICMVLLMRLGNLLAPVFGMEKRSRLLGILAALLYGCSTGAMATTLLIRMYGVVTCLCVALLYIHVKKWLAGGFASGNKGLIAVTVLGFLTQYFFLFYCLVLAAVTAVMLWCSKRRKELSHYIRSMVTAAVIGVGIFPFAISDVFSSERGVEALDNLSSGLLGYGTRLASFGAILVDRTFGSLLWVILLVLAAVLVGCLIAAGKKKEKQENMPASEKLSRKAMAGMLLIPVVGYFLLAARMSPYLVDRYIMPLFPFVILLGVMLVVGLCEILERQGKSGKVSFLLCGVIFVLQIAGLIRYDGTYLYENYGEQEQLAENYAEYPCICVYTGVGYYENLPEFTHYDRTLLLTEAELENRADVESISSLEEVMVLVKPSADWEHVFTIMEEKYGLILKEEFRNDRETGDGIFLFVKSQR